MKHYGAMRFVAGLLKLIGWLIIGFAALVLIVGFTIDVPNMDRGTFVLISIGGFVATVILGIFTIASGEMIAAVADIAVNAAYLRSIAANTEKTAGFFEHISNKSNAPTPTVS